MMNLRPGGPSRHEMNDQEMMRGYGAMMPQNQGLTNQNDQGLTANVGAEHQHMAQQYYKTQQAIKNVEDAGPAMQIQQQDAMRELELANSNKQNKIQTGLNTLMANIIENTVPSGGKYLTELHATTAHPLAGPEFQQRLRKGQALGVPQA